MIDSVATSNVGDLNNLCMHAHVDVSPATSNAGECKAAASTLPSRLSCGGTGLHWRVAACANPMIEQMNKDTNKAVILDESVLRKWQ